MIPNVIEAVESEQGAILALRSKQTNPHDLVLLYRQKQSKVGFFSQAPAEPQPIIGYFHFAIGMDTNCAMSVCAYVNQVKKINIF